MKTIGLSEGAYRRLDACKRPGDSFSDVVDRLTGATLLRQMAGTMPPVDADHYEDATRAARADADRRRQKRAEDMA